MILLEINKEDTSPSFRSVRFPKPQIFVEMFRRNLLVGAHVVHQYGGRKIVQTSGTYFGYLSDLLSELNKQAFT